ncbi:actin-associated protein FAM107A isoform X3 [Amphiprion ocellaris]|uniref:actin-associated protein FAM107A isoform X3 n=1 Tax=Amphiprion ocellaris TaxID=80972 RepID=UPI0024116CAD|nr:actin-associated protein FAM107A isoform X3 [Amphiprion ocellaris]
MGVTHGKKRDLQHFPASMMKTPQPEQEDQFPELQGIGPSQLHSEEEGSHLIRPHKPLNPITASKSHQELHKELQMTHKRSSCVSDRRVTQEGKTELQRALEKRKWEQRMKASRDQQEANKNTSPLHQELLKRQQRLENLEREEKSKQEEPEFLQVKERLRRTTVMDAGEKQV